MSPNDCNERNEIQVIQTILPYSSKGHNKDDDTNDSSDFNNDDDG